MFNKIKNWFKNSNKAKPNLSNIDIYVNELEKSVKPNYHPEISTPEDRLKYANKIADAKYIIAMEETAKITPDVFEFAVKAPTDKDFDKLGVIINSHLTTFKNDVTLIEVERCIDEFRNIGRSLYLLKSSDAVPQQIKAILSTIDKQLLEIVRTKIIEKKKKKNLKNKNSNDTIKTVSRNKNTKTKKGIK